MVQLVCIYYAQDRLSDKREKRPLSYIDALYRDTGISFDQLSTVILDQTYWKDVVNSHLGSE